MKGSQMNINVGNIIIGEREKKAIMDVLNSGRISEGKKVREFEVKWADYVGTKYSVLMNSGTSALIAGLTAIKDIKNFKNGSKIITTPLTYIATTNAIKLTGFEPIFIDVDEDNFNINPEKIKSYLESAKDIENHSMILPVHLMGYAADMKKINSLAKKYNLEVFEDAAQAHGTKIGEKRAGSMSLAADFSFYIAHNIQAGELGVVNTDNFSIYQKLKKIKANGRDCDCKICTRNISCPKISAYKGSEDYDPRFTHSMMGYNFKTTEFSAALALVQLEDIEWNIKKRKENVAYLNKGLKNFSDILKLPEYSDDVSYLAYPIVIKDGISRMELRKKLSEKGIESRPLFGSIPTQQPAYNYLKKEYEEKLPTANRIGKNGFYIGCHQYLNKEELDYTIESIKEILSSKNRI